MKVVGPTAGGTLTRADSGNGVSVNPVQRPSLMLFGAEPLRAAMELVRHVWSAPSAAATGDGQPVVLFPGLGAGAASLTTLVKHCRGLGYDAFDWRQGVNHGPQGDLDSWLHRLADRVTDLTAHHAQRATFIGWSLGGLYARELGKLLAPRLQQVITIGTPFNADADYSHAGWLFRMLSGSTTDISADLYQRLRRPPPVRTTSMYSRSDGVVAWQTCCHATPSRLVQDIEIHGSHLGMGWNPEVLRVLTDRLSQTHGPWRTYARVH